MHSWRIGERQLFKVIEPAAAEQNAEGTAEDMSTGSDGADEAPPADDTDADAAAARMPYFAVKRKNFVRLILFFGCAAARIEATSADRKASVLLWVNRVLEQLSDEDFPEYKTSRVVAALQDIDTELRTEWRRRRVQRVQERSRPARRHRARDSDDDGSSDEEEFEPNAKRGRKARASTFEYRTDEELAAALQQLERMEQLEREQEQRHQEQSQEDEQGGQHDREKHDKRRKGSRRDTERYDRSPM